MTSLPSGEGPDLGGESVPCDRRPDGRDPHPGWPHYVELGLACEVILSVTESVYGSASGHSC